MHKPRVVEKCELPLQDILTEMGIDLKKSLEENNYLPLEPFCSTSGDLVATEDHLKQLKERKQTSAFMLNLETSQYEEVVLIDEDLKDELSGVAKKKESQSRNSSFWIRTDKGFKKVNRW